MTKLVYIDGYGIRPARVPNENSKGAFGAHPGHDAHLLSTLSAIQILIIQNAVDRIDIPRVVKCK